VAQFTNAEIRHGSRVVRANVELDSFIPITGLSAGEVEWSGVLRPPNNTGLAPGETYTLVLPNFSPARILITGEANPIDGSVSFQGVGQPPVGMRQQQVQKSK